MPRTRIIILHLGLILTSLFGYMEWGGGQHMFLFEAEAEVLGKLVSDPVSVIHPLVLMPLFGQGMLLLAIALKHPPRWLTWAGIGGLGLLHSIILLIGLINPNLKMLLSTIPYLGLSALTVRLMWNKPKA